MWGWECAPNEYFKAELLILATLRRRIPDFCHSSGSIIDIYGG